MKTESLHEVSMELINAYDKTVESFLPVGINARIKFEACRACAQIAVSKMIERNEKNKTIVHLQSDVNPFLFVDTRELVQIRRLIISSSFNNYQLWQIQKSKIL
jgi:hypothetical protein